MSDPIFRLDSTAAVNVRVFPAVPFVLGNDNGGTQLLVYGEVPTGAINGINATFQSLHPFMPESLAVYLNGVRQKVIDDYQTSGTQTVTLAVSPAIGEKILFDYLRSN